MSKSKVYFTNMRTTLDINLLGKLSRLMDEAGFGNIDFDGKFAAIKVHFGEPGNLSFLRPNYAKTVADKVKELGGKPFLTDCNTLYVGGRKNALDHLESAYLNGFTPFSTGCHIIIADGLKGTDEVEVPIDGELVKNAKIGRAVMDADVFISLTHFKGHELTGFGGTIKNIGMGCGSRAGKMEMHCDGKPQVDPEQCRGCGVCAKQCAHSAITLSGKPRRASIDHNRCVGCGRCIGACAFDAIANDMNSAGERLAIKMAEYTYAVLKDRPQFHISVVADVSPNCDCRAENDVPIIQNVGLFASFDPVALDMACVDACNSQPALHGSVMDEREDKHDHFTTVHPTTNWRETLQHAEKLGLGSMDYELVTLDIRR